jgi:hypothetical protein
MTTQRKPLTPKITPKQAKIVKRKVQAVINDEPQRKWAKELYPNATQAGAEVEVSKNLNKPNVKLALELALEEHGITVGSVVGVVADGMKATKIVVHGKDEDAFADEVVDHSIRLKAAGMAANFMGLGKQEGNININFNNFSQEQREHYNL